MSNLNLLDNLQGMPWDSIVDVTRDLLQHFTFFFEETITCAVM